MRNDCRACGNTNLREMLDLGTVPLAGAFLANAEAAAREQKYPLKIHVCDHCALVQILDAVDPEILFQDYSFSSSTINPLVQHFDVYAEWLTSRYRPARVVEFGCNDGVLLAPLQEKGVEAIGVDVSRNITEIARDRGLKAIAGYFNAETGRRIREDYGPADIVTGSNAFAHNDRPEKILEGAREVLGPEGRLCLEVMYAGDLLEQFQWDTLYHEHLTFYSLHSLAVLLDRYGFHVEHAERIPMHGGSLRVVASVAPVQRGPGAADIFAWEQNIGLSTSRVWEEFGSHIARKIRIVRDAFGALGRQFSIWGYGAAGKATMWVNTCEMNYLGGIVDASPLRAGKFMPGTHTPIVYPEQFREADPDYVFVTAWNYADHIRAKESWYSGTWSTPLPDLRFF